MKMKVLARLLAGGVTCLAGSAVAQDTQAPGPRPEEAAAHGALTPEGAAEQGRDDSRVLRLDEVVVVGSPVIEGNRLSRYAGQTTVIAREQIEALNAQDLASALRRTPGVTISRYNPIGSFGGGNGGAVFIRGMGSSRPGAEIQTLIDGVPVYNSIWNHPLLDLSAIDPAHSIEVRKGVQPAEFGNAFSVVNIVPTRRTEEGHETRLSLAGGNYDTLVESIEHGGKTGAFDYLLGQGYRTSDGHRSDADGELQSYHLRLGYAPDEHWDVSVFALRTDNYAHDPGPRADPAAKDGRYETRGWLTTATIAHTYEAAEGTLKLYWNRGDGDWLDQAGAADDTLNDWDLYGIRAREALHLWDGGEILTGVDLDYMAGGAKFTTDAGATDRFDRATLRLLSPYAAVSHELGSREGLYAVPSAGLRFYDHSVFDSELAPHAGLVLGNQGTELHVAYARGITYPGLNVVVFSENVIGALGDSWEDLDAEKVHHYEAGISQALGERAKADLTWFYDDGQDRYVFYRKNPPGPPNAWANIEEFTVRGVEATLAVTPTENISFFGGATYIETSPEDLPYSPKWTFSGGANIRFFERFELSLDAQYVKEMTVLSQTRLLGAGHDEYVGSHCLLNGKLTYNFTAAQGKLAGKVFVAVENITDEDYEYLPDYPMPGVNGMAGVEFRF